MRAQPASSRPVDWNPSRDEDEDEDEVGANGRGLRFNQAGARELYLVRMVLMNNRGNSSNNKQYQC